MGLSIAPGADAERTVPGRPPYCSLRSHEGEQMSQWQSFMLSYVFGTVVGMHLALIVIAILRLFL